jgi:hypothetical protein
VAEGRKDGDAGRRPRRRAAEATAVRSPPGPRPGRNKGVLAVSAALTGGNRRDGRAAPPAMRHAGQHLGAIPRCRGAGAERCQMAVPPQVRIV